MAKRGRGKRKVSLISMLIVLMVFGLTQNWQKLEKRLDASFTIAGTTAKTASSANSNEDTINNTTESSLVNLDYVAGKSAVINVNNDRSTLNFADWHTNQVNYSNLDNLNRTANVNTAYLEARNLANDLLRERQYVQPTGWHQKYVNKTPIINRGHLIAYSLSKGIASNGQYDTSLESGDQNNPKNLFTQTAFSNQKIQTIYESRIRDALRRGHKVIFAAHAIFRGNELMARGVQLQAISDDGSLNFNVFIFNVQPGVTFDYATGRSRIDKHMKVPSPPSTPRFHNY